ncbi:hypothetical protein BDV09DRAFT_177687 [Aspergillus tetrazonus]
MASHTPIDALFSSSSSRERAISIHFHITLCIDHALLGLVSSILFQYRHDYCPLPTLPICSNSYFRVLRSGSVLPPFLPYLPVPCLFLYLAMYTITYYPGTVSVACQLHIGIPHVDWHFEGVVFLLCFRVDIVSSWKIAGRLLYVRWALQSLLIKTRGNLTDFPNIFLIIFGCSGT